MMTSSELKAFLDEMTARYNRPEFISTDPVAIPRSFSSRENIEIAGFLTATLAWGSRKTIISRAASLMRLLDNQPYDYIMQGSPADYNSVLDFCYRTFNGLDAQFFLTSLRNLYQNHGGLEKVFSDGYRSGGSVKAALRHFHSLFFELSHPERTRKHVSDVTKGSAAKRLNLFLRWMVRNDNRVDFGLWKQIPASALMLPLDVHTSRTARGLGILRRKQNDWLAVEEVTAVLRDFDPDDPVRYDFALFGLSVTEDYFESILAP